MVPGSRAREVSDALHQAGIVLKVNLDSSGDAYFIYHHPEQLTAQFQLQHMPADFFEQHHVRVLMERLRVYCAELRFVNHAKQTIDARAKHITQLTSLVLPYSLTLLLGWAGVSAWLYALPWSSLQSFLTACCALGFGGRALVDLARPSNTTSLENWLYKSAQAATQANQYIRTTVLKEELDAHREQVKISIDKMDPFLRQQIIEELSSTAGVLSEKLTPTWATYDDLLKAIEEYKV